MMSTSLFFNIKTDSSLKIPGFYVPQASAAETLQEKQRPLGFAHEQSNLLDRNKTKKNTLKLSGRKQSEERGRKYVNSTVMRGHIFRTWFPY